MKSTSNTLSIRFPFLLRIMGPSLLDKAAGLENPVAARGRTGRADGDERADLGGVEGKTGTVGTI